MMIRAPLAVLVAPILCQTDAQDEAVEPLSLLQTHAHKANSTDAKTSSLNRQHPSTKGTPWQRGEYFSPKYSWEDLKIGIGCKDRDGNQSPYGAPNTKDFTCIEQNAVDTYRQFNDHFAKAGGCVAGEMRYNVWHTDLTDLDLSKSGGSALGTMEACRKAAEVHEDCAGANYYTWKGRCECGLSYGPMPVRSVNSGIKYGFEFCDGINCGDGQFMILTCLLKSLSVDNLGAGPWNPPFTPNKVSGIKSTFKMSKALTGCSKGWWRLSENPEGTQITWMNEKTHTSNRAVTDATTSPGLMDGGPSFGLTQASSWNRYNGKRLPSTCASTIDLMSKMSGQWSNSNSHRCIGARGVIMQGRGGGSPQASCGCWYGDGEFKGYKGFPEDGSPYGTPSDGKGMHYGAGTLWVCELDGGDYTGGDEAYPIPPASGIYDPDGPQGPLKKPKRTPEQKAQCKASRGARKDAKKALKDARAAWAEAKKARDALRLAKAAFKASKEKESSDC